MPVRRRRKPTSVLATASLRRYNLDIDTAPLTWNWTALQQRARSLLHRGVRLPLITKPQRVLRLRRLIATRRQFRTVFNALPDNVPKHVVLEFCAAALPASDFARWHQRARAAARATRTAGQQPAGPSAHA